MILGMTCIFTEFFGDLWFLRGPQGKNPQKTPKLMLFAQPGKKSGFSKNPPIWGLGGPLLIPIEPRWASIAVHAGDWGGLYAGGIGPGDWGVGVRAYR